jgi:hypothetical protein
LYIVVHCLLLEVFIDLCKNKRSIADLSVTTTDTGGRATNPGQLPLRRLVEIGELFARLISSLTNLGASRNDSRLVCGSRNFTDAALLEACLDEIPRITAIIEGGALRAPIGSPDISRDCAASPSKHSQQSWPTHGLAAGAIRNKRMLVEGRPDLVMAFPGGPGLCRHGA